MLTSEQDYSLDEAQAILNDTIALAAQDLLPLMVAIESGNHPQARLTLDLLRDWDGDMRRQTTEPLIFHSWLRSLKLALLRRASLKQAEHAFRIEKYASSLQLEPQVMLYLLRSGRRWCGEEGCQHLLASTLDQTLEELSQHYGSDITHWRWGEAHRAPLAHPILHKLPWIGFLFRHNLATSGGPYTVNQGLFLEGSPSFDHVQGAGLRVIFDLAHPTRHRFMIATGQSGNPFSPFYSNLLRRWRDGAMAR